VSTLPQFPKKLRQLLKIGKQLMLPVQELTLAAISKFLMPYITQRKENIPNIVFPYNNSKEILETACQ
jgi:hypothetical protein